MITVKFYSFAKRLNSTKQPTAGTDLSCLVKSDSSIINPVIEVSTDPTGYNYCYISAFGRYYYIEDIVFQKGIWICYCSVDVLASYKTTIGSTSGYCVRSSQLYNTDLQDDAWTVSTAYTREIAHSSPAQYSWAGFDNGYYVVGVKGTNTTISINGVIYYLMTPTEFTLFIRQFYNNTGDSSFFGNLARGIADSIYNLSDFIVSCRWYPFALYATTQSYDVYIGSHKVTNMTAPVLKDYPINTYGWTFTVPKHPQASVRGSYMNAAPYTKYVIKTPWGMDIPLNSYYMRDRNSITLNMRVDFTTGQAVLDYGYSIPNDGYYSQYISYVNFGVDIPLSGTNVNVSSLVQHSAGAIGNVFAGNMVGALSNVGNALLSAQPDPQPVPSRGGYAALTVTEPILVSDFYECAPTDYTNYGRPCCQVTTPATIGSGFMMFENCNVQTSGTRQEQNTIDGYMASGFFYE